MGRNHDFNNDRLMLLIMIIVVLLSMAALCSRSLRAAEIKVDSGQPSLPPCESGEMVYRWDPETRWQCVAPTDPREACPENVFRFNGEEYECIPVDRIQFLMASRNSNFQKFQSCMSSALVERLRDENKGKCRALGKKFDDVTVECTGALPAPERKQ